MERNVHPISRQTLLLASIVALLLTSCDPGQSLRIENRTNAEATMEIIFSDANGYYDLDENSDSNTLLIKMDTSRAHSFQEYHFGIGTWEINHAIDTLAASIESIEITTWKSTTLYKGRPQIVNFFESRLTGRQKESIEIILE